VKLVLFGYPLFSKFRDLGDFKNNGSRISKISWYF